VVEIDRWKEGDGERMMEIEGSGGERVVERWRESGERVVERERRENDGDRE
jgi:hypothetical protein